ncbi:hypothetical protein JJL56_32475 [Azospirillum sp. YIM DDC1]|uniref:DUF3168 domain-containing protein n=1 Tax=Azospirillum aestuarii TaxID=2802052 RepID=A0ABS1I914_9PROT|nr:hypothetical protein [Azospirillum aestuarii]MBK4723558.1 hypothetical protein [Azospirillum aestuarii]
MATPYGSAAELETLFGILEGGWAQRHPLIPIAKPWGEKLDIDTACKDPVTGAVKPYIRLSRKAAGGQPLELGVVNVGSTGLALIDVFVPEADGAPLASLYGDEVLTDFATFFQEPGPLALRSMVYTDVGPDGRGWYQGSVTVTFLRQTIY